VKCADLSRNTRSEGEPLGVHWRWYTKAWVSKQIRDLCSPRRKRWVFGIRII